MTKKSCKGPGVLPPPLLNTLLDNTHEIKPLLGWSFDFWIFSLVENILLCVNISTLISWKLFVLCVLQLNWFLFIFSLSRISPSSPNSPLSLCVFRMYKKTEIYDIYPFKYCFKTFLVSFTVDYTIYTHFLMVKPYSHFL